MNIEAVIRHYVRTLLWSESCRGSGGGDHEHTSTDPGDCDASLDYMGYDPDDLAADARTEIEAEVRDFCEANADDLAGLSPDDIGHNFLLSRNGHGAGFFDRGWGERGNRLQDAARRYGDMSAYVGDDDKVHVAG